MRVPEGIRQARRLWAGFFQDLLPTLSDNPALPRMPRYLMSFGFDGRFELTGGRILGWIREEYPIARNTLIILIYRGAAVVAWAQAEKQRGDGIWRFDVDVPSKLNPREFLAGTIRVCVVGRDGGAMDLRMEGSAELDLINEVAEDHDEPFLVIDFGEHGTADSHLLDGWSFPEKTHRWMTGKTSALSFKPPEGSEPHALAVLLWPFTVDKRHPEQALDIFLNDIPLGSFALRQQTLLKCRLPERKSTQNGLATLRFIHPDAVRPCDYLPGDDSRLLSLAVKKIRIMPIIAALRSA